MSLRSFEETEMITLAPRPRMVTLELATADRVPTRVDRRRRKLFRFVVSECIALATFIGSCLAGTSETLAREELTIVFKVLVWVAVSALAIIPIVFFGFPRRGYRVRRYT